MSIHKKYKSPLAIIIYICTTLAAIAGGIQGGIYIKDLIIDKIDTHAEAKMEEWMRNRKGGFRSELSEWIGVPKDKISEEIAKAYYISVDSLEKMRKTFVPMLMEQKMLIDVGLKVNRITGRIMYRHVNGEFYRAFKDSKSEMYYFINEEEKREWCK